MNSRPDDVDVRAAQPADASALAHVHVASWRAAYRSLLPQRYLDELSVEARERTWARRLDRPGPNELVLVAVRGGRVVGFASAGPLRDGDADARGVGEVYAVYVLPDEWGGGAGRQLLERALEGLAAAGFAEAWLWVLDTNERARGFYEHLGWRPDGATKQERFGARVTEVRYRLPLRSPA